MYFSEIIIIKFETYKEYKKYAKFFIFAKNFFKKVIGILKSSDRVILTILPNYEREVSKKERNIHEREIKIQGEKISK